MLASTLSTSPEALIIRTVRIEGHRRNGQPALVKAANAAETPNHIRLGLLFCDGKEEGLELMQTRDASPQEKTDFLMRSGLRKV